MRQCIRIDINSKYGLVKVTPTLFNPKFFSNGQKHWKIDNYSYIEVVYIILSNLTQKLVKIIEQLYQNCIIDQIIIYSYLLHSHKYHIIVNILCFFDYMLMLAIYYY